MQVLIDELFKQSIIQNIGIKELAIKIGEARYALSAKIHNNIHPDDKVRVMSSIDPRGKVSWYIVSDNVNDEIVIDTPFIESEED